MNGEVPRLKRKRPRPATRTEKEGDEVTEVAVDDDEDCQFLLFIFHTLNFFTLYYCNLVRWSHLFY